VIEAVKKHVTIPVSIKISYYFSGLTQKLISLSQSGIAGMVLFNRPYSPDIDIDNFKITAGNIYSSPAEYAHTLRWVAILAGRVGCDIAATTGIHNSEAMIKQLLAGANAVQVTSALYKNGLEHIQTMLNGLEQWI
jgi:dihydroorotate dehydrogenase (fumarate)